MRPVRQVLLGGLVLVAGVAPGLAEVLIGFGGSITGSYTWGTEQNLRGAQQAIADLNNAGGVLGELVEMTTADDYCDGEQGVAAANKLVAHGVVFVVGHMCSGASIPASKVYADAGILMISPASTNPTLTDQGLGTVFRVVGRGRSAGSDGRQTTWPIAGPTRRSRFSMTASSTGRGLAEETKRELNQRGVHEALFAQIEPGRADYIDVIEEMRALGIDVVYYAGYSAEAGLIIRQARDRGYQMQMIGGDALGAEDFALIAGQAGDGTPLHPYAGLLQPLHRRSVGDKASR